MQLVRYLLRSLAMICIAALGLSCGEDEAMAIGKRLVATGWVSCGSSWFERSGDGSFNEFKGVNFAFAKENLTAADKANGVVAKGAFKTTYTSFRRYGLREKTWGRWQNANPDNYFALGLDSGKTSHALIKEKGTWRVHNALPGMFRAEIDLNKHPGFTCADVPK